MPRLQRIDPQDLATAERLDCVGENGLRARYQDGTEKLFEDVEVYAPSLIRWLYRRGHITRGKARAELRKMGLKIKPDPDEPVWD